MLIEFPDTMLGRNILYLRKKYHLSRKALSCLTGISIYTLKDWETEKVRPVIYPEQLKRICAIFNISGDRLVHNFLESEKPSPGRRWPSDSEVG